MYHSPESRKVHRIFVLFETEKEGEQYVFGHIDDRLLLPGVELMNGDDPKNVLKEQCPQKYGLTPVVLRKYHEAPEFWDEEIGGPVITEFYKALEFTGDFPPDAEFIPSQYAYDMIKKLKIDFKKPKK